MFRKFVFHFSQKWTNIRIQKVAQTQAFWGQRICHLEINGLLISKQNGCGETKLTHSIQILTGSVKILTDSVKTLSGLAGRPGLGLAPLGLISEPIFKSTSRIFGGATRQK